MSAIREFWRACNSWLNFFGAFLIKKVGKGGNVCKKPLFLKYLYRRRPHRMQQLLGEYDVKLDTKGRIRLPSGLIAQLGESAHRPFVVNRGFEKNLTLYPEHVWERITREINDLNIYNKKKREFVRYFYRGAQKLQMDGSDRILLNKRLLEYAGIDKEVILSAVNDRVEIWAVDQYDQLLQEEPDDFSELAEEVLGSGGNETPDL